MITGGRIPLIREMNTDEFGLRSMQNIDPVDLRMWSEMWDKRGLVPMDKFIERYFNIWNWYFRRWNAESMIKMLVNLPAEVITQGLLKVQKNSPSSFTLNTLMDP
jgi:hypothetical protein